MSKMKMYQFVRNVALAAALACLTSVTEVHAMCQEGDIVTCSVGGQAGTKECIDGHWSGCELPGGGPGPAPACLSDATGSLTATPQTIHLGENVTLQWNVSVPSGCDGLQVFLSGQLVHPTGNLTVQPVANSSYSLSARFGNWSGELASASIVVDPGGPTLPSLMLEGYTEGFDIRQIGLTESGKPLLQSFYFRYTEATDHHFSAMGVVPNSPEINDVTFGYVDEHDNHEYFYHITLAPYFGDIIDRSQTEFCDGGSCTRLLLDAPPDRDNYVFVIRGFEIGYRIDDHHIDQLKIEERDGFVTVALNDDNNDDSFSFELHYAYIPKSRVVIAEQSGTAQGAQGVAIPSGTAVIRGFNFDLHSGDHHTKDIGVVMDGNGQLEVYYGDKDQDDWFDWHVEYAILIP